MGYSEEGKYFSESTNLYLAERLSASGTPLQGVKYEDGCDEHVPPTGLSLSTNIL